MNYRLTSCKSVIGKVYRDLKPGLPNWENDAIEWIGEVVEFIGYTGNFLPKQKRLKVTAFRTEIPCDFYEMETIFYKGVELPYGQENYEKVGRDNSYTSSLGNKFPNQQRRHKVINSPIGEYYLIDPGYIKTSFQEGEVVLHYKAFPTDNDGIPMIPDNIYFKDAAFWYIVRQLLLSGFVHPTLDFQTVDAYWFTAKIKAENELMFPTPARMEHFRNMWVKMIPGINAPLIDSYEESKPVKHSEEIEQSIISDYTADKLEAMFKDLKGSVEELLALELGDNRILNSKEPSSSSEPPIPENANYYQGDDYLYVRVSGIWKRHHISTWT